MSGTPLQIVDRCRICGCGGDECRLEDGELCGWANDQHDLCTRPRCLIAADRARKAAKRQRKRDAAVLVKPIRERVERTNARDRQEKDQARLRRQKQLAKLRRK